MLVAKVNIPLAVIKNKYVYLCGGFNKVMLLSCELYSFEEDKWFKGPKLNYPRANCSACTFDDRFIYICTGKTQDQTTVIMEKLDTGLDGSSTAMRSLDEDLKLPMEYKWEAIIIKGQKEFIENLHFNATIQVSNKDILIFGGVNKLTYKLEIDSENKSEKLVRLDDSLKQKSHNRFVFEKDFQSVVRKNKLYAIDANYKMLHIFSLKALISVPQELNAIDDTIQA